MPQDSQKHTLNKTTIRGHWNELWNVEISCWEINYFLVSNLNILKWSKTVLFMTSFHILPTLNNKDSGVFPFSTEEPGKCDLGKSHQSACSPSHNTPYLSQEAALG